MMDSSITLPLGLIVTAANRRTELASGRRQRCVIKAPIRETSNNADEIRRRAFRRKLSAAIFVADRNGSAIRRFPGKDAWRDRDSRQTRRLLLALSNGTPTAESDVSQCLTEAQRVTRIVPKPA
jgi:hypothetical protein